MTARQQLDEFLARYEPAIARLTRAALSRLRKRFPGADVLVYDNYNALALGFTGAGRPSDAMFSIAAYPRWVTLFFLYGADLPDPEHKLSGSGKRVRSVRLESLATLDEPAIVRLLDIAAQRGEFPPKPAGQLIIQSIAKRQRPRRPLKDR
jgi:hypothetical protein